MQGSEKRKKSVAVKMILMGIVSIALYALLFAEQEWINTHFAKGGLYALLPIITAFVFSIVHGSFTGNFWSFLGMHPKQKREGQ
jgi:hypothetical protein